MEGDPSMTRNISTFRSIVTRCLAAGVLLCIYCAGLVGASALVLAASTHTAGDRGGGGGCRWVRGGGLRRRGLWRWWLRRWRLSRRLWRRRLPWRRLPWPRFGVGVG